MLLTKKLLKGMNACEEGIKFAERNSFLGYDLDKLDEVKGDYKCFIRFLKTKLRNCTFDENKNLLTHKDSDGYSKEFTYDENKNLLTHKDSDGYLVEYTYDEYGNRLTSKDSNGYSKEWTYDENGNILTFKDSNGFLEEYMYDENGNELTYKDNNDDSFTRTFTRTKDFFIVTNNDVEVLRVPLKNIKED